ncbi:MAG: transketolase family protein [Bacteroidales bacterium]
MTEALAQRCADNIRILAAAMVEKAKSGHPGGAMGGADFVHVLFSEFLACDPDDMAWANRDRFFLDPGHMSPMLYGVLHLTGQYTTEDLMAFRQWGSATPGHPEREVARGVENTSGPLGQGHAMAVGAAIAERFLAARFGEWLAHKTFAYVSDGAIQEEISQATGRIAGHLGLANLVMFYDSNGIQLSHSCSDVTSEDTARKYEAWGWRTETIPGNDIAAIRAALARAVAEREKPTLIIGHTVMGKGVVTEAGEPYEGKCATHGMPLGEAGASFAKTVQNLGGDPANPFAVFPDVAAHYAGVRAAKSALAAERKARQKEWEAQNPGLAQKFRQFLSGEIPAIDYEAIAKAIPPNSATRNASGKVLGQYARQIDNMIVASADLSNSDKTDGFLKETKIFRKGNFSGKFLQVGVSELTMAALANGMALHGGVIPVCSTFFVFSDYMKPAVRLSALMELPVKFAWSHDAFRVGEDGPTHQPVEQEAQIRLLEKMHNPRGHRSMLVLRPADGAETVVAWKMALENRETPTALIFSRQNVADLPGRAGSRFADAEAAVRGAYIVSGTADTPDVILVANGSEVSTLAEAAQALTAEDGLKVRLVSVISEGLFAEQPDEYRASVLPFGVPTFGLTAGLPAALTGVAGPLGKVVGLTRFGASAPYKVLDEKFGFTRSSVVAEVRAYLEEYGAMAAKFAALQGTP